MLKAIRFLLLPFSWVYGLVVVLRNLLYDYGLLKSHLFDLPVIVVGNLEVGGSGKTPVIEYLIRLLKEKFRIAVLSRGYGRETKGFIRASIPSGTPTDTDKLTDIDDRSQSQENVTAARIGDEPFQYFSRFSDITVAVGENRVAAIRQLAHDHDVILLDDAFQHRRLVPGLSIVVLDYNTLFKPRLLLPAGNYREPFSGKKRAGLLLISKAPCELSAKEREHIIKRLAPAPGQPVCFSSLEYDELMALDPVLPIPALNSESHVLLLTGIARPGPLVSHVKKITSHLTHLKYPDHHSYTVKNIAKIAKVFEGIGSRDKIILTTEKDAARLRAEELKGIVARLPIFYRPVRISIHEQDRELFDKQILEYLRQAGK